MPSKVVTLTKIMCVDRGKISETLILLTGKNEREITDRTSNSSGFANF